MTKEEQRLLKLEDLSARLPYGVCVEKGNIIYPLTGINVALGYVELAVSERISIEEVKYYLRKMSSMTEEEWKEYDWFIRQEPDELIRFRNAVKFYNKHHIDYNDLIPNGLALEAPEGMYNFK